MPHSCPVVLFGVTYTWGDLCLTIRLTILIVCDLIGLYHVLTRKMKTNITVTCFTVNILFWQNSDDMTDMLDDGPNYHLSFLCSTPSNLL